MFTCSYADTCFPPLRATGNVCLRASRGEKFARMSNVIQSSGTNIPQVEGSKLNELQVLGKESYTKQRKDSQCVHNTSRTSHRSIHKKFFSDLRHDPTVSSPQMFFFFDWLHERSWLDNSPPIANPETKKLNKINLQKSLKKFVFMKIFMEICGVNGNESAVCSLPVLLF